MIHNSPSTTSCVPLKRYNFNPDIWDGVAPPPGSTMNEKAWQKEKDLKFKIVDDPKEYKKFSRTLQQNKETKMNNLSPIKYDKRMMKMKKDPSKMKK